MEFEIVVQGLKGYIRNYAEEMLTKSKSKDQYESFLLLFLSEIGRYI